MRVGFIGWRGMVGSVLMSRMLEEKDFQGFEPVFFTTSNVGGKGPDIGMDTPPLKDAYDIGMLSSLEMIVTCQGGDYTKKVYPEIKKKGWKGYWIDAASTLRMEEDSIIILDPVNSERHSTRAQAGHQDVRRRKLHGQSDAHGPLRPLCLAVTGRMDHHHDLPGRVGRRGQKHDVS